MSNQRWHVVCSDLATDTEKHERIWTISRSPTEEGWTTDAGCPGYGLTYAEAQELASAANSAGVLRAIVRSVSKYAFAADEIEPAGLKRKLRAQIKTAHSLMAGQ